jgi:hypothetical protein
MASNVVVTFLNSGIPALLQSSTDFFGVSLDSFIIGDSYGFTVDPAESAPRGTITYTGARDSLQLKLFDDDESMKVSLIIPEQYNNIRIGNIVVYALYRGEIKPFVSIVLPELVIKTNPSSQITDQNFKYPGNRLVIGITVRYVDSSEITSDFTINVVIPNYANIPYFGKDKDIPSTMENPHSTFIVNEMDALGGMPGLVTKSADGSGYYASPLFQNIASPKFGVLNSFGADILAGDRIVWIWGQSYATADASFRGTVGGLAYADDDTNTAILGGLSY